MIANARWRIGALAVAAAGLAACASPAPVDAPETNSGDGGLRRFNDGAPCFRISAREVTHAQYRKYLEAMADPETERRCRHPDEPDSKLRPGSRLPLAQDLAPDEPVRGVDWWDAYAFARWSGGSIPTESDGRDAAR